MWLQRIETLKAIREAGDDRIREFTSASASLAAAKVELDNSTEKYFEFDAKYNDALVSLRAAETTQEIALESASTMLNIQIPEGNLDWWKEIKKIEVSNALNDCVDFSAGVYKLNILNLRNCGDKALSVGEKSFLILDEIFAENIKTGIASKDSSIVKLKNAEFKNLKTCVSAYNKKREFSGGFIEMQNMKCENYLKKVEIDSKSKIFERDKEI